LFLMDPAPEYHDGSWEQVIAAQALETPLKPAVMACLSGGESARWTLAELADRLRSLAVPFTRPALLGSLLELQAELDAAPWAPWRLLERGQEWILVPKTELYGLLLGVRAVPVSAEAPPLSDDEKAVLVVVLGYRRHGVSKTRISEILRIDPGEALERLCAARLIRSDTSGERVRWVPREETLLRLGYRAFSEIAALRPLEEWFEAQEKTSAIPVEPALERSERARRRWSPREAERRASTPQHQKPSGPRQA
jgi:hypothetical protein